MYKLRYFEKLLCQPDQNAKYCNTFTIWCDHYYPLNIVANYYKRISPCNPDIFPSLYWFVLAISIFGLVSTFLLKILCAHMYKMINEPNKLQTSSTYLQIYLSKYFYLLIFTVLIY